MLTGVVRASWRRCAPRLPLERLGSPHAGDRPVATVQHHHAHVASAMGEHGADAPTSSASPSTAPGTGPTARSGAARYWSPTTRLPAAGHLAYVPLPGGDASVQRLSDGAGSSAGRQGRLDQRLPPSPPARRPNVSCAPPVRDRLGLRADLQHGPALRRGRSLAGVRHLVDLRGRGRDRFEGSAAGAHGGRRLPLCV